MGDLTHLKQGPGVTPHRVHGGQDVVEVFAWGGGGGEITCYRGIDVRWAH